MRACVRAAARARLRQRVRSCWHPGILTAARVAASVAGDDVIPRPWIAGDTMDESARFRFRVYSLGRLLGFAVACPSG